MLSRAERLVSARIALERIARGVALALLAWLLVRSLRSPVGPVDTSGVASLTPALKRWSMRAAPSAVHVRVDGAISPAQRDWLAALAASGTRVTWSGAGALPVAAVAEPVADPAGATRIVVAAPAGAVVSLADEYGSLDSVRAASGGAGFLARSAPASVTVRAGVLSARAAIGDSLVLGRLLVLGRAGWESKFVVAALEERGWSVDARLALSPRGDVVQGRTLPIDTAHYSAVIALDSSALGSAGALARYVRSGGGLVLAAPVSAAPPLAPLELGALRAELPAVEPFDTAGDPRRTLALTPIALREGAVALERRSGSVAVAVRRVERGRVMVVGYADTWRWRMAGGSDAAEQHRDWWAGLVASVAHVGRITMPRSSQLDESPLASLVECLGPATTPALADATSRVSSAWLFAALAALLLGEWASRRLRGAR
ncbi:MAG: hypothetical protein ACHQU8_00800 [Gemmatimonadales bacterium]